MMPLRLVLLVPLALCLAAAAAQAAKPVRLIPRQVLFGNPERAAGRLSPDGQYLSFLAPVDGVLNIWVGPAGDPKAARPITKDTKRGIRDYFWAYTNRHIVYLQDKDGDENWRVYCVTLNGPSPSPAGRGAGGEGAVAVKDLTPLEGVQARIQEVSYLHPDEILIGLNDRNKQLHDIYRVNLETGKRELLLENKGFLAILTDEHFTVRLGITFSPLGGLVVVKFGSDGSFEPFMNIAPDDALTTSPAGFDKSGENAYLISSQGRNTAALLTMNLATKETKVLAEDARVDIGGVMMHPAEKTIQAYATNYERTEWHALDPAVGKDLERLRKVADGDPEVVSRTLDDSQWLVVFMADDGPVRYYRYDRKTHKAKFLFTVKRALEKAPLVKMHPVVIKSRDGLDLVSYVTLPKGSDPDGNARPSAPLPTVLWIHGGPWFRDSWGLNPVHQWLANRGYAVLSVNYRGSTGFGKSFINAANQEWGRKMHDDVLDAVKWAIAEKIADPKRIAMTGGSYGGYETLVSMTMSPEVFACGVDLVGISNLVTWLQHIPEYWIPIMPLLKDRVGDVSTDEGKALLMERSPISYADKIARPLLIGQGKNDPRVPQQESDQLVKAMQDHKIPVTYLLYSDEGHGFARPENSLSFWAVEEAFLAKHLGGRYEPIGKDFEGSTIQVLAGADQVPGLTEAQKPPS
jgi:dipeptidyl aminopeptidase/acylaminoacyl peptidase